jgi:hypothetical protein
MEVQKICFLILSISSALWDLGSSKIIINNLEDSELILDIHLCKPEVLKVRVYNVKLYMIKHQRGGGDH